MKKLPDIGEGFRGPDGQIPFLLRQAHTSFRGAIDRELAPIGISGPQFSALNVIARLPRLSGTELSRVSMLTQQTTNEILLALAHKGLIRRIPRHGDRRILEIALTNDGRRLVARARKIVGRIERRMVAGLDPADQQLLRLWLVACARALAASAPPEDDARPANSRLQRTGA